MKEILKLSLIKNLIIAGETVNAFFKAPFSGRMLVTMETDKVMTYQYVNVDANE